MWVTTIKKSQRNDINNTFAKAYSFLLHINNERMDLGILKI